MIPKISLACKNNVYHDSAPYHFTLGSMLMDQPSSGTVPIVVAWGKEYIGKPTLALEVSSGKVIAQTVLSKFTRVRILTQGRAANIGESITAIPLEYPHPFMSVESLFHCQRP